MPSPSLHVAAIIAAGGRGTRYRGPSLKQLETLGGVPVLQRSVEAFLDCDRVADVIVALPEDLVAAPPAYLLDRSKRVELVAGGARRQDSVAKAFERVSERAAIVVVHDAARPLVSADLIARTIDAAAKYGAAIAAVPVTDTVKRARHDGTIVETLSRSEIFLAQTPQAFRREVLREALRTADDATDESTLVERAGHPVHLVAGEASNLKITTPEDLATADRLLGGAPATVVSRVGVGYDLHRLVPGRPLILGGVTIPFEKGLLGHSDADVVSHAVTDALLGAAGAGDIGRLFPDTDPAWKGADSIDLLGRAAALVKAAGFSVVNLDVVVIAERPKLLPYIEAMCARLAAAIGVNPAAISVKGKTNEGLGDIGAGNAIAVHAVALLGREPRS